ncbi:DNA polymerase III subunit chi [Shewanella sp. NIFS-20-20]|uniref:DNA polymerase III subunit chi n=1 Tax=Shewanella sp. NIFS-20-20 TaxID=2853806 RepID=UPI001C463F7F|nr:DNA polymerase III subunit chi [Shewanella sp. NIFS-20-20]MBV7314475.1 DNA polymerase III subunit chi [Shewanella sp. NIFS-20-20]
MSQAIFYLLPNEAKGSASERRDGIACQLANHYYQAGQTLYIHCQDQAQAFHIDEILWQFEPDAFVPHNLKGEGPQTGAPVEIGFDRLGPNKSRHLLINLADQCPSFAVNFSQIIDFVASDNAMKAIARERYKQYRQLGIALDTQDLATQPLDLD